QADWTLIGKVKANPRIQIPIFGNGDLDSPQKVARMRDRYGVDGVMIGRAAIGNPWIFRDIKAYLQTGTVPAPPTWAEKFATCQQHLEQAIAWKGELKGIYEMRQHYTHYLRGLPKLAYWRSQLMTAATQEQILAILTAALALTEAI
ncbi:MAG: tRNA-dihydrouridine synthase, partial [Cyanobacteria bacterium P01_H01_bin.121]